MKKFYIPSLLILVLFLTSCALQTKDSKILNKRMELSKEKIGNDGAPMVLIPAGEFQMGIGNLEISQLVRLEKKYIPGGIKANLLEKETPRHTVYLNSFYIDKYEVTNAQYRRFVQETGHKEPEGWSFVLSESGDVKYGFNPWQDRNFNGANQPVICVSWEDAKAYAEWAGKELPTEAEWEKAARGGREGKKYVWGAGWLPRKAGNFADVTLGKVIPDWLIIKGYDDGYAYPAPVGSFIPNGYGLFDMVGNVEEWCADWYGKDYYLNSPRHNPTGPDTGAVRVVRDGAWLNCDPYSLHIAHRHGNDPADANEGIGFRCVSRVSE